MSSRTGRTVARAGLVAAAGLAIALTAPQTALAAAASPGDEDDEDGGVVQVHGTGTAAGDRRNQPHVCAFYLAARDFAGGEEVAWRIRATPRGDRRAVAAATMPVDGDGTGRSAAMRLAAGHYRLTWTSATTGGEEGKSFKVDCEQETETDRRPDTRSTSGSGGQDQARPRGSARPSRPSAAAGEVNTLRRRGASGGTLPGTQLRRSREVGPEAGPLTARTVAATGTGACVALAAGAAFVLRRRRRALPGRHRAP